MTYTVSKFKNKSPPPIFGIGKGNSYIHYNYRIKELKVVLPQFLEKAVKGTVLVDQAIRLRLRVSGEVFRSFNRNLRRWSSRSCRCRRSLCIVGKIPVV